MKANDTLREALSAWLRAVSKEEDARTTLVRAKHDFDSIQELRLAIEKTATANSGVGRNIPERYVMSDGNLFRLDYHNESHISITIVIVENLNNQTR